MKKQITYKYEFENSRGKDFLLSLLNKVFILVISFLLYASVFLPIGLTTLKETRANLNASKEIVLNIGLESKLMHSDSKKEKVYSLTESYKYYVRTILRYDYECGDYDLVTDPDNYKLKQEEMDLFPLVSAYNDDFLGYFYVTYASAHTLVDYQGQAPSDYFKYEVLNIDDLEDGGVFFTNDGLNQYPHLKSEVRTALYRYVVLGSSDSSASRIDSGFFTYFSKIYEKAGNILLEYEPYKNAYDQYVSSYNKIYEYDTLTVYVGFFVSVLIVSIIVPLFNKHKQNLGQLVLRRVDLNSEEKMTPRIYLVRFIYDIFRNFPTIAIFAFFVSQEVLFGTLFSIGPLPVSLLVLILIPLMMNIASLMLGLIRHDTRNLLALINNTDNYQIKKSKVEE